MVFASPGAWSPSRGVGRFHDSLDDEVDVQSSGGTGLSTMDGESGDETSATSVGDDCPVPKRMRFIVARQMSEELVPSCLASRTYGSLKWWADPVSNALQDLMDERSIRGIRRPMKLTSFCSGTFPEGFCVGALGLPIVTEVACDTNQTCRSFMAAHHGEDVLQHIFSSMQPFCADRDQVAGFCTRHQKTCSVSMKEEQDCFSGGSPCQPFSDQRGDRHSRSCVDHPLFSATFGDSSDSENGGVIASLDRQKPKGGILEQVSGFAKNDSKLEETPLNLFLHKLKSIKNSEGGQLYTGFVVLQMTPEAWVDLRRERIFVVFISDALGGQAGADEIRDAVLKVHRYRKICAAHQPVELLESLHIPALYKHREFQEAQQDSKRNKWVGFRLRRSTKMGHRYPAHFHAHSCAPPTHSRAHRDLFFVL